MSSKQGVVAMENNKHDTTTRKETNALMKRPESIELVVAPLADLFEVADAFVVKLDMPGATKESLNLSVEPNQLTVKAIVLSYHNDDAKLLFSEIIRKNYLRKFNLGNGINIDKILAQFEDGVLTITLPKTDEVKAKTIQIH
jgi:HSP20 family protein